MENNHVIKRNFVTDLFQFCVNSIKMLQKTNLPTEYDNLNEKQRHNYNNIMINFLLFVAKKQTDPSFRDMFARLAFYLYVFLEKAGSVQSGGVLVLRGNVVMDVNDNEIQPGDLLVQYVQGGIQLGQQVVQYAAPLYDQAQQQLMIAQPNQQMIPQPPQQNIIARQERFDDEMQELERELALEQRRGALDVARQRRQLMRGEVLFSQHALNASTAAASGFCCAVFMNTSTNLSSNAFQNFENLVKNAASGAGEALYNVKEAVTPEFVKAGVSSAYNLGKAADNYVASWFTTASPSATDAANSTLSDLVNSTTIDIGAADSIQEGYFQHVWDKMIGLSDKLHPGDLSDSASQCGLCCCVGVFTHLTYGTIQRAKNTQLRLIEGAPLNAALNREVNETNQTIARAAAAVGAVGIVATTGPGGIPAAMSLLNTTNAIMNNPVNNVDNQVYPQLAPVPVQAGPQPILLGAPQPVQQIQNGDPNANVGLRQRNVVNNQGQNAGYQKFKKTKKSKRNNKKTRKMKRNNRKSRKYKRSKK